MGPEEGGGSRGQGAGLRKLPSSCSADSKGRKRGPALLLLDSWRLRSACSRLVPSGSPALGSFVPAGLNSLHCNPASRRSLLPCRLVISSGQGFVVQHGCASTQLLTSCAERAFTAPGHAVHADRLCPAGLYSHPVQPLGQQRCTRPHGSCHHAQCAGLPSCLTSPILSQDQRGPQTPPPSTCIYPETQTDAVSMA